MTSASVVVRGPWTRSSHKAGVLSESQVLGVRRFGAVAQVARSVAADPCLWSEARLVMESRLHRSIADLMSTLGYVPLGPVEWEQTDDLIEELIQLRASQLGLEDSSEVWVSVRKAVAEDQAIMAKLLAR